MTVVLALAALAVALGSERFGGLVPCALCLVERWPYRVAAVLGVAALAVPSAWRVPRQVLLWLVVVSMVASVAAAVVHVGVEQGRWPSPLPECAAPSFGGGSIAERLARMPARPSKPCDAPTFLLPGIPISMAGLNLLLSVVLGGFLVISLAKRDRSAS
ncbi:MAG: disulfide bond formation protein B [Acetobacteraceae bacterium]